MKSLRLGSILFSILLCSALFAGFSFNARASDGYVTISFVDYAERIEDEIESGDVLYEEPLGVIIPPTRVAIEEGDTVASVTLRLLDSMEVGYQITGSVASDFYLAAIENVSDPPIDILGEFDCGVGSGWMITLNNWFINQGASAFAVEDGDIIRWQYTCQYGNDINCSMDNPSAEITGLLIDAQYGELTPDFDEETESYILNVPEDVDAVKIEAQLENYWSSVTYSVGETQYGFLRDIPVQDETVITIESSWAASAGDDPSDTDKVVVTVSKEGGSQYQQGDVNLDGIVSAKDALFIRQFVIGMRVLNEEQTALADVRSDGILDAKDALKIRQFVIGLIDAF